MKLLVRIINRVRVTLSRMMFSKDFQFKIVKVIFATLVKINYLSLFKIDRNRQIKKSSNLQPDFIVNMRGDFKKGLFCRC